MSISLKDIQQVMIITVTEWAGAKVRNLPMSMALLVLMAVQLMPLPARSQMLPLFLMLASFSSHRHRFYAIYKQQSHYSSSALVLTFDSFLLNRTCIDEEIWQCVSLIWIYQNLLAYFFLSPNISYKGVKIHVHFSIESLHQKENAI